MKALAYPFSVSVGRTVATTISYDQIVRGQVIDALMTNMGERVMRPNYGCDVQAAVFDPSDELVRRDAASWISERLQGYCPRCLVRSIDIEKSIDRPFEIVITIVYRPTQYSTDQVLEVPVSSEFIQRSLTAAAQQEVSV